MDMRLIEPDLDEVHDWTRGTLEQLARAVFLTMPATGMGFGWVLKETPDQHAAFKILELLGQAERHPYNHRLVRRLPEVLPAPEYVEDFVI